MSHCNQDHFEALTAKDLNELMPNRANPVQSVEYLETLSCHEVVEYIYNMHHADGSDVVSVMVYKDGQVQCLINSDVD